MKPDDLIQVELDPAERRLLGCGLSEWGGPARCTEEFAVAMGFISIKNMFAELGRLRPALESGQSMTRFDWCRVLLATEIVFVSDVVGSGWDWQSTTGVSDAESLVILRRIQRKLIGHFGGLIGGGLGTWPGRP